MRSYYLRLSVTERCDLRCVYCRPRGDSSAESSELDTGALLGLVEQIDRVLPLRKIRLTGGEPLLRADMVEMVGELRRRAPGAELCLTTNGARLDRLSEPLRRAGLDRVNVSVDAADARAFGAITGGGRLERVKAGLEAARAAGLRQPRLNAVLLRSMNRDALGALVRLALEHEAEIRFIELMPIGEAAALHPREFVPAGEALELLARELGAPETLVPTGTARRHRFRIDGREVTVGFVTAVSAPFCGACDRLRLDSRGKLYSCLREGAGWDLAGAVQGEGVAAALARVARKHVPATHQWEPRRMASLGG